jgi:vesicle coat complex subunit
MAAVGSESENQAEIAQLRERLNSNYPAERKAAAKRAVSMMRSGDNVQSVFSDMLKCGKTDDLEVKKLVYLYLVNYSSHEPEQAIMSVNLFLKDCVDSNPLIRALAVRTMSRIRLESVGEYVLIPLKQSLKDPDPYVRKTGAFGVAKLYDIIPEHVENSGMFPDLLSLLRDENPMVVANTTAAIFEINQHRASPIFQLNSTTITPILAAFSSSSEWCQAMFLDAIAQYAPEAADDISFMIDRFIPMLQNSNPSVVVSAFKCIFLLIDKDSRNHALIFGQVIPPFITLVTSAEPEIQYVVLRTMSLFVQKYPRALAREIRVFFCKYNEPSYVKLEKLNIIVTITNEFTAADVLDELNEYCNAVDVEFVKRAVKCIGQIALKIDDATAKCVDILVGLVDGKAEYAIEEAVVVVSDILRRFPGRFESVIAPVCHHFPYVKEPRAKAAAVWILGEYCELIEQVDAHLDPFLDTFHDEPPVVQLQILTAIVKLYLAKPNETQDQLQYLFNEATNAESVPDVRNRAYIYWRLLSTSSETTQRVIRFNKQSIVHSGVHFDETVLEELLRNIGSVAGVLHIVPSDFVHKSTHEPDPEDESDLLIIRNWRKVTFRDDRGLFEMFIDWEATSLHIKLTNNSAGNLREIAIAVNRNPLGIAFADVPAFPAELSPGESCEREIGLVFQEGKQANFASPNIDLALKINQETAFASSPLPVEAFLLPTGRVSPDDFRSRYPAIPHADIVSIPNVALGDDETLRSRNVFVVGRRENRSYLSFMLPPSILVLAEVIESDGGIAVQMKCSDGRLLPVLKASLKGILVQR